jgi:hypothetical protein
LLRVVLVAALTLATCAHGAETVEGSVIPLGDRVARVARGLEVGVEDVVADPKHFDGRTFRVWGCLGSRTDSSGDTKWVLGRECIPSSGSEVGAYAGTLIDVEVEGDLGLIAGPTQLEGRFVDYHPGLSDREANAPRPDAISLVGRLDAEPPRGPIGVGLRPTGRTADGEPVLDTVPTDAEARECARRQGEWRSGIMRQVCVTPTRDGGKACTDGDQCEAACITDRDVESGAHITGRCEALMGAPECFNLISDGVASGLICE